GRAPKFPSSPTRRSSDLAHAMEQMALAVQDVASGASRTSVSTSIATEEVDAGYKVVDSARGAVNTLAQTVVSLNDMISRHTEDRDRKSTRLNSSHVKISY